MRRKKKKNPLKFVALLSLIVFCGGFLGYSLYSNLDYQKQVFSLEDNGYQFNEPVFLKTDAIMLPKGDKLTKVEDVWINSKFAENSLTTLIRKQNQVLGYNASVHPTFHLIDLDGKQTNFRLIADLSTMRQVKRVVFPTWGEKAGPNDLKMYEGNLNVETNTWQTDIQIKNHREVGRYQTRILVVKDDGQMEEAEFGEFLISEPTIDATIDPTRVVKGQFTVNIKINSAADVEKLSIPIWSKEDQSDVSWYEGVPQGDKTYKVEMDYENHNFNNGIYTANVYLTIANGLTSEKNASTAEINLAHPVRIRLLQNTVVFQDRRLTKIKRNVAANTMAYVEGIVFNSEEKIYRITDGYVSTKNTQVMEMMEDVRYIAHRGNKEVAPENSLPAFQQASTWGVETDLWLTKDKQWVVMHDETVDRTTTGKGKVSDLTLAQIKGLRINAGSNVAKYDQSQLVVPTLEEYFAIMKANQKIPYVEIKPKNLALSDYASLASLIQNYGFSDSVRVISFDYGNLLEMRKQMPNVQVQLLSDGLDDQIISKVSSLGGNVGLDIEYKDVLPKIDLIAKAQSQGVLVNLWVIPKVELVKVESLGADDLTIVN